MPPKMTLISLPTLVLIAQAVFLLQHEQHTDRNTKHIHRQTDRQTDRHTDIHTVTDTTDG